MEKRLADKLEAVRHQLFVGRAEEKALFFAVMQGETALSVLYVHGLGGVGKTTLLHEWESLANECGATTISLDARNLEATSLAFVSALATALGLPRNASEDEEPETALESLATHISAQAKRCVVFVDTYELLTPLDGWLRETLLPALPDNVLFVLAGRQAPALAWSGDAGWSDFWRSIPLYNLDQSESSDYLSRRLVPANQHGAILDFTHGHPLALSLVADLFSQRRFDAAEFAFAPEAAPEVINTLLGHMIEHEADFLLRAALQACALVRLTTEDLLAQLLDVPDAHGPFEWLRSLSFIQSGRNGLFPHDMAREVLQADLRWRNPTLHRELHTRARLYYTARLRSGEAAEQQRILFDYVFLHRNNPVVRPFLDWRESGTLLPGVARPDDLPLLAEIVERHEGVDAAALATHWFSLQPRGVLVLRDTSGHAAGFLCSLSLSQANLHDINSDPATQAAWRYLEGHAPLRAGEEATYFRFWMSLDNYQEISPAQSLIFIHIVRHYLTTPGLAFSFFACASPEFWAPIFHYAGAARLADADFQIAGRQFGVYGHDWRALPPLSWLEMLGERELATEVPGENGVPKAEVDVLRREEFDLAVQHALRDITRPHVLRNNALLRTRLVTARLGKDAEDDARVAALQSLVQDACNLLRSTPRDNKLFRALDHTYLHPAPTQEQAAILMDVPFSTYRRHLKAGINAVCELLWKDELNR